MQTPAGKECRHYHADFHRGRNVQECRLIRGNTESMPWKPQDCAKCEVPDILNANASRRLELTATVKTKFMGFGRIVEVKAFCDGKEIDNKDAYTSCGDDRPGLHLFRKALENSDDD